MNLNQKYDIYFKKCEQKKNQKEVEIKEIYFSEKLIKTLTNNTQEEM